MRVRAKLTLRNDRMIESRHRLGLTQYQLAELADVSITTVANLESMNYTDANLSQKARRVADALELPIRHVLPKELAGRKIESTVERIADVAPLRLMQINCQTPQLTTDVVDDKDLHDVAKARIAKLLGTLTFHEREIIKLRMLDGDATLDECAEKFHVTRERIRQIENKALCKLRQPEVAITLLEFMPESHHKTAVELDALKLKTDKETKQIAEDVFGGLPNGQKWP